MKYNFNIVIQCYMFRFNGLSSGTTLKNLRNISVLAVCIIS